MDCIKITSPCAHVFPDESLTGFDTRVPPISSRILLVFRKQLNRELLVESLKKALGKAPYFGGSIMGTDDQAPYVSLKNPGIFLELESSPENMIDPDVDDGIYPNESQLVSSISINDDGSTPAMSIKVTNFSNGSILALTFPHMFGDASSIVHFLTIGSGIINGSRTEPFSPHTRQHVIDQARCYANHPSKMFPISSLSASEPTDKIINVRKLFRISKLKIKREMLINGFPEAGLNGYIHALLWKAATLCSISQKKSHSISLIYNARKILGLEPTYLGNCLFILSLKKQKTAIIEEHASSIANELRTAISAITPNDIYQDINFWEHNKGNAGLVPDAYRDLLNGDGIYINNLTKLPFYDLDLGAGKPIWFKPLLGIYPMRFIAICPSPAESSYDLHVLLPAAEMDKFRAAIAEYIEPIDFF